MKKIGGCPTGRTPLGDRVAATNGRLGPGMASPTVEKMGNEKGRPSSTPLGWITGDVGNCHRNYRKTTPQKNLSLQMVWSTTDLF
jgi:hypothetical protein